MSEALEINKKTASEVRLVSISFVGKLDFHVGEVLTGAPTIPDVGNLTITSKAVSTEELEINGKIVPIGRAVQFLVSGGNVGDSTEVTISCATDSSPAQTLYGNIIIVVVADSD